MWSRGKKLISATSPELGVGVVLAVDDDGYIDAFFPDADKHLRLSTSAAGIKPVELSEGDKVRLRDGSVTTIEEISDAEAVLADGSTAELEELWPHLEPPTLVDHLANSAVDPLLDVLNRVDGERLLAVRRRTALAEVVGARIEMVPEELGTARRILAEGEVRHLLAGAPDTGRMSIACMVLAAMVRAERCERVVIVAPHRRAIRWLAELYRNYHQLFVNIDLERWQHVREEVDIDANPFEVYPRCVVSSGLLASEEELLDHLREAPPDLAIVDEANQAFAYLQNELFFPLLRESPHALALSGPRDELGEKLEARLCERLDVVQRDAEPASREEIPADFDETLMRFCIDAAERVEFEVTQRRGTQVYYFEYGPQVKVNAVPGLTPGARFLGTFDRETALDDEGLDFFASGHPLVEGLLAELRSSPRGRVGAVRLRRDDAEGFHGLYLLVVEGDDRGSELRLIPLMDASGVAAGDDGGAERARALYAALDMGIELEPDRVRSLMERVANHPLLDGLDASTLSQAILVAVMDHDS